MSEFRPITAATLKQAAQLLESGCCSPDDPLWALADWFRKEWLKRCEWEKVTAGRCPHCGCMEAPGCCQAYKRRVHAGLGVNQITLPDQPMPEAFPS